MKLKDAKGFPKLIRATDIEPVEMRWLWYPYLPLGTASMLFGQGGLGKSTITCSIAAAVSTGRALPGQRDGRSPQKVLMLSAEDDLGAVIRPRLELAGADLDNIYLPQAPFILDPLGVKVMEDYMKEAAATVVFIDPIVSYMGGKIDMHRMNEVRELTGALADAARRSGTAVVIVHHARKGKEGDDCEKAAGSADFNNAVRSTLFVRRDKDGDTHLVHCKTNYAKLGPALPYEIADGVVVWGEPDYDIPKGNEGEATVGRPGVAKEQAQKFIRDFLAAGPRPAQEVLTAALAEGINDRTLNRAKIGIAESFVEQHPEGGFRVWCWRLLGDTRTKPDPKAKAMEFLKARGLA